MNGGDPKVFEAWEESQKNKTISAMSDTILRQMNMLVDSVSSEKTFTNKIKDELSDLGYETTIRTIQKRFNRIIKIISLVSDERSYPFG